MISSVPHGLVLIEFVQESPCAMALLDLDMRYIAWSDRWVEDYGLSDSDLAPGTLHYDVFPELGDGWRAIHRHCLRGHAEEGDVELFKRADGAEQWVRNMIRPWYVDADETEIGGLVLSIEDLTLQIEAQRQLARQKSLLNTVVDHAPAVLYSFDTSGTVLTSIGRGLSGLGPSALGTSLLTDYPHLASLSDAVKSVLAGESVQWESEANGQFFETSAVPTREAGVVTGGLAVAVDVTERTLAQRRAKVQAEGLRRVLTATARPGSFEMQMEALLAEVSGFLGLDGGVLSCIEGDTFRCIASASTAGDPLPAGTVLPLGRSYGDLILKSESVLAIEHVGSSAFSKHPAYATNPYEAYIGGAVLVEGRPYGTLSFSSKHPAERPFESSDMDLVQLASQWAGGLVERELRAQETNNQSTRLRSMADLFAVRSGSAENNARTALSLLCYQLKTDVGVLARADPETRSYTVVTAFHMESDSIQPGHRVPIGDTYSALTLDAEDVLAIDTVARAPENTHPLFPIVAPEAFIGAPVIVDNQIYGIIDLSSLSPRKEPFTEADRDLVRLTAGWVGGLIERSQQQIDARASSLAKSSAGEYQDEIKRSLLDAMSHEIRTPMNAVVGFGDLLETTALDEVQREYVGTIRRAGVRLLRLIDDVLDFSKVEADRLELEDAPFYLSSMAEDVLDQFAQQAARKGIELSLTQDESDSNLPRLPTRVIGDEKRVHQILSNLVSNAVKFTASGQIELAVRVCSPKESDPVGTVPLEFEVSDTGIGIPTDRLMHIFEPFVQADASTTRQYGGTGLGLAISRQLVEKMGGAIDVDSQEGEGSRFRVRIPMQMTDAVRRQVIRPSWEALSGLRVLLVDDDADALVLSSDQCRAWGMSVQATADPMEALAWLDDGEGFELALLDMQMPVMNGIALANEIRERREPESLPIVILSSDPRSRHAPGLVQAVLQKPVSSATLHALLLRTVGAPESGLRRVAPRARQARRVAEATQQRGPFRILVAEDEPDNQTLTLHMLRTLGYEAEVASDGAEALTKIQERHYDLVFMDVMMPKMDGLEVTRRLRSGLTDFKQPRVVALTARALRSDREACLQAGMDDYLSKPVRIGDLARALDAVG